MTAAVFAQTFTVNYLDGTVELQQTKGWKALAIGDQVAADATIRVSDNGSVELQRGKTKVTLLKDGTYQMAVLAKSADKAGSSGVGTAVTQKLQALVTEKPKSNTAGGARGAEQGTGTMTWVDESEEVRTRVQTMLDNQKYSEAANALKDALDEATSDSDTSELKYLLGVAYYGAGQPARAYKALSTVDASPNTTWYARFIILKAQVFVDTANYKDAVALLSPFISTYPTGDATQVAYLLSGMSQKGLGDAAAAKTAFDAGLKMNPASDTAKLIQEQMKAQ
jgi:TolA-binding protein